MKQQSEKQYSKKSCPSSTSSSSEKDIDVISWMGDIVYLDYQTFMLSSHFTRVNETEMDFRWNYMKNRKEYQEILKHTKNLNGIYDDHDFAENDVGGECDIKD